MEFEKIKPRFCPESGRRLQWYWCFSCHKFHWPYKIVKVKYEGQILPGHENDIVTIMTEG